MDIPALFRQLENASFPEREALADSVASRLDGADRRALVQALVHPTLAVRLGVLSILGRAGDASLVAPLLAHARSRSGDDRIFALRALVGLARPGDEALAGAAREFLHHPDPFAQAQAQALLRAIGTTPSTAPPSTPPTARAPGAAIDPAMLVGNLNAPDRHFRAQAIAGVLALGHAGDAILLRALLVAKADGPRLDLVAALEGLPGPRFVALAGEALAEGNGDVAALVARALIRQAANLPRASRGSLRAILENTRRRLAASPLAAAALDDALGPVVDADLPADLWEELIDADEDRLAFQVDRWLHLPAAELAVRAPVLIDAAKKHLDRWAIVGPALDIAVPALRPSAQAELRGAGELAVRQLTPTTPGAIVAPLAQILAQVALPGTPLPVPLFTAAEHLADGEILQDLCRLCLRLASEESALRLLDLARDPLPEVAALAEATLQEFRAPYVRIARDGSGPGVATHYRDPEGQDLRTHGRRLFHPTTHDEFALDLSGDPVPVHDLPHGACLCCPRPRQLGRYGKEGLRCPSTWSAYLLDKGRLVTAADHPLGRCARCESISARVREGAHTVCPDCGDGRPAPSGVSTAKDGPGEVPSHPGEASQALPRPPSRDELLLVAPHIRHAMAANIFVVADGPEGGWTGSGIIVAREGTRVAILTNRHMVETEATHDLPSLRALSLGGEDAPLTLLWRAEGGVDLALVEAHFSNQDALEVMALGQGACMVGSPLFAIGNPLGLAWSYTSGTLSAIRHWETADKIPTRLIQTDVPTAPGSSGGGLFHQEGHLVGIISFGKQGDHGDPAHFAISVPTIRETVLREGVYWQNRPLFS